MTKPINVSEAKARLSELIDRALEGEEVVIARRNKPVVKLVICEPREKKIVMGRYAGKIWIADDFDEPLEDFAEYM